MLTMTREDFDANRAAEELLDGAGALVLKRVFDTGRIARIQTEIVEATDKLTETGSHFNQSGADTLLQRRIWFRDLVDLDHDIAHLVEDPMIFQAMQAFLGTEFVMGSLCASRIMPGFGGQEPHIDYPYWDFHRSQTFPMRTNASFPLNAQAVVIVDPFTEENGATALAPGTQADLRYPGEGDDFFDRCIRLTGDPGDVVLFFGAAWHCAMPNNSDAGRIGLLVEFLPKFVKPIEDLLTDLNPVFLDAASSEMRQLLGFRYPWPSTPPEPPMT